MKESILHFSQKVVPTIAMIINLVRLLQLCSQTLPVGAYAYSQALEFVISGGLVNDQQSAEEWIEGVFLHSFGKLDLPALAEAHDSVECKDWCRLKEIDEYLQASRETRELLLEDVEMGRALKRLIMNMDVETGVSETPSFVTQFACAGVGWGIGLQELLTGLSYNWLENQVMVATKTVPLGQSEAQKMLHQLCGLISTNATEAIELSKGSDYGDSLHGLAIMSSRHEAMEARLYRS